MTICAMYGGHDSPESASRNVNITDNCSNSKSLAPCGLVTCDFCGGEGWIYSDYVDSNGEETEIAGQCPECNGSGYVEGEPEPLSIDDLDMRSPIDCLLEAWAELAAKGIKPGVRRRIAGHCDRRLSWQYRVSEC